MGYIQKFPENKILFTVCDCKSEILYIEYDPEMNMADIAVYESGVSYRSKMSFWQKIRYIWRVLIHGRPYADQMMLTHDQMLELKRFLDEILL